MKYLTAVGAVASAISAVHAICCLSDDKGWCYDGTPGTPCCAMETCNFFSCACDGGKPAHRFPKDIAAN